jgi:hypothetical protein
MKVSAIFSPDGIMPVLLLRDPVQNAQKHAGGQSDGSASYPASARFLDLAQYARPGPWHDAKAALQVRRNNISRAAQQDAALGV